MKLEKLIYKIKKYSLDPDYRFLVNASNFGHYHWMDDEKYIKKMYKAKIRNELNLDEPSTYNEKLQWLKLHDRNPLYHILVDKYEVKNYVANIIGQEHIIPTLGLWEKFDDIDFNLLPNKFVLKCTHDSGGVVICKDKKTFNIDEARKKINKSLNNNYYWLYREWPYKNLVPRIIAEENITPEFCDELDDYKMLCFNGKFEYVMVCEGRHSKEGIKFYHFDKDWNYYPFVFYNDLDKKNFDYLKPKNYEKMIEIANLLGKGFAHVRIDLYNIEGIIYFGEITLYQAGGFDMDYTEDAQVILGNKINLLY